MEVNREIKIEVNSYENDNLKFQLIFDDEVKDISVVGDVDIDNIPTIKIGQ